MNSLEHEKGQLLQSSRLGWAWEMKNPKTVSMYVDTRNLGHSSWRLYEDHASPVITSQNESDSALPWHQFYIHCP